MRAYADNSKSINDHLSQMHVTSDLASSQPNTACILENNCSPATSRLRKTQALIFLCTDFPALAVYSIGNMCWAALHQTYRYIYYV